MADAAATMLVALLVDALLGEPGTLYRHIPHPVVLLGRAVTRLEALLLDPAASPARQRAMGLVLLLLMVGGAAALGWIVAAVLALLPLPWLWQGVLASSLIAQRSLVQHVAAVAAGLRHSLDQGRRAVAHIVGRDPEHLDRPAVGRAALESLAENLSDGVVAPVLWGLALGLPGLLAYKAVNTLDSMVGYRNERYRAFGWASARADDLVNLPASRLTALLLAGAAALTPGASPRASLRAAWRDAAGHRSPNAGWPEAALAGALDLRLAGPRRYGGVTVCDRWMGHGRAAATPEDIARGLALAWRAWALLVAFTAALLAA